MKTSEILDFLYGKLHEVIGNHQIITDYIQKTKKQMLQKLMVIVLPGLTVQDDEESQ